MNDTCEETANLLILAVKNLSASGIILSRHTMMFNDFNYQRFNPSILDTKDEEEVKPTGNEEEYNILEKEQEQEKLILDKNDLVQIMNAQQMDELVDLSRMKASVNSEISGNVRVRLVFNYRLYLTWKMYYLHVLSHNN